MKKIIKFILSFFRKCRILITMKKMEKQLAVIGEELSYAYLSANNFFELDDKLNSNKRILEKYHNFFYLIYYSWFDELIHVLSRLHDKSRDSLSLIKILESNIKSNDELSKCEEKTLDKIKSSEVRKKIETIRDKLKRAHLDGKVSLSLNKQEKILSENTLNKSEIYSYLGLLEKAVEVSSERLEKPLRFLKPMNLVKNEIKILFDELNKFVR